MKAAPWAVLFLVLTVVLLGVLSSWPQSTDPWNSQVQKAVKQETENDVLLGLQGTRASADNFGSSALHFLEWPTNYPISKLKFQSTGPEGEKRSMETSIDGVALLENGVWSFVSADREFVMEKKKVWVRRGDTSFVTAYRTMPVSVIVRSSQGAPQDGLTLEWESSLDLGLGEIVGETGLDGSAHFRLVNCPSTIILTASSSEQVVYKFPFGYPVTSELVLYFDSVENNHVVATVQDAISGDEIKDAVVIGGNERIVRGANGRLLVPLRWGHELEYIEIKAPGYLTAIVELHDRLPELVQLFPSVDLSVKVFDLNGGPVANGAVYLTEETSDSADSSDPRSPSRDPIYTDVNGFARVPAIEGRSFRVCCISEDGLFGEAFVQGVSENQWVEIQAVEAAPLRIRLTGRSGIVANLSSIVVKSRLENGEVLNGYLVEDGEIIIRTPSFVDWIHIEPGLGSNVLITKKPREYSIDDASLHDFGGRLEIYLPGESEISGYVRDLDGTAIPFAEFALVPKDVPELGGSSQGVLAETPLWLARSSAIPLRFTSAEDGRFLLRNLPRGVWEVQTPSMNNEWALGQSFQSSQDLVVPTEGLIELEMDRSEVVHLTVEDGMTGRPIPEFQVRVAPVDGRFIGFSSARGTNGRWSGRIMKSVLTEIEIWANGYRVVPVDHLLSRSQGPIFSRAEMIASPGILGRVVGAAANSVIGWPLSISEVRSGSSSMFRVGLWQQTIVFDSSLEYELMIPDGVSEIQIKPLVREECPFQFMASRFSVYPGSSIQIEAMPK